MKILCVVVTICAIERSPISKCYDVSFAYGNDCQNAKSPEKFNCRGIDEYDIERAAYQFTYDVLVDEDEEDNEGMRLYDYYRGKHSNYFNPDEDFNKILYWMTFDCQANLQRFLEKICNLKGSGLQIRWQGDTSVIPER